MLMMSTRNLETGVVGQTLNAITKFPSGWAGHGFISGGLSPWAVINPYINTGFLGSTELWPPEPHPLPEGLFSSDQQTSPDPSWVPGPAKLGCRSIPVFKDLRFWAQFAVSWTSISQPLFFSSVLKLAKGSCRTSMVYALGRTILILLRHQPVTNPSSVRRAKELPPLPFPLSFEVWSLQEEISNSFICSAYIPWGLLEARPCRRG